MGIKVEEVYSLESPSELDRFKYARHDRDEVPAFMCAHVCPKRLARARAGRLTA